MYTNSFTFCKFKKKVNIIKFEKWPSKSSAYKLIYLKKYFKSKM